MSQYQKTFIKLTNLPLRLLYNSLNFSISYGTQHLACTVCQAWQSFLRPHSKFSLAYPTSYTTYSMHVPSNCHPFLKHAYTHTRTHPFNGPLSGTTQVSWYQKVKPIWILLKQETVSGSGISWAICKSAPRSRQIPRQHPTAQFFLQARCPSCCPTNSVKALKAI